MLPRFTRSLSSSWSKRTYSEPGLPTATDKDVETPMAPTKTPARPQDRDDPKDDSLFWDQYVKEADMYDSELVKGLGGDLDTLLIFAGLFSAVNTAFIIESYQDLKPDPAESGGTNALLRSLIQAANNSTAIIAPPANFVPSPRAVAVNALFFASLCCSLFAAFGAVLAKQWLNEYERTGDNRIPHARARQRHAKFLGMQKYHCEMVMQALGTVLQVSLFLFFLALVNWLWGINRAIAAVVSVGFAITFGFYFATTVISVYDAASPFATRLSSLLRELRQPPQPVTTIDAPTATAMAGMMVGMVRAGERHELDRLIDEEGLAGTVDDEAMIEMDGKCIAWVRDNATTFESVAGMARAAASLPHRIRHTEGLYHTRVGPALLRSIISSNAIPLGLANGTLFSTVNTIRDAMTSWKGVPIYLACDVISQLHQTLRLAVTKDPVLAELIALTLEHIDIHVPPHLVLRTRRPEEKTFIELLQAPTLTLEGKRATLSLLWKYHFREKYWASGSRVPTIRDATGDPPEDSWHWKVADALLSTATSGAGDDPDGARLKFRVCWAVAFGPTSKEDSRTMVFGDDSELSSLWSRFFRTDKFKRYFTRRLLPSFHQHRYFAVAAADLLASSMGATFYKVPSGFESMLHSVSLPPIGGGEPMNCQDLASLNLDVLETTFQVHSSTFHPTQMAPLYAWFHLKNWHNAVPLPAACANVEYLRRVVYVFLREQLSESPGPWIPAEHMTVTMAAIRAYVDEFSSDRSRSPEFDHATFRNASSLQREIRARSYCFKGPARDGQQLWDCFQLVLGVLLPGELPSILKATVDWNRLSIETETETETISGSKSELESKSKPEPEPETNFPVMTSQNFRTFHSY